MSMSDDLFGDFRDDSILEHLDDEMESTRFPSLLSELNVLLRQELTRLGYDPRHSVELVAAICSRIGGMQLYFPRGQVLEQLVRDMHIWLFWSIKTGHFFLSQPLIKSR